MAILSPTLCCGSLPCHERRRGCRCRPGVGLAVDDAERSRHLLRRQSAPNLEHHTTQRRMHVCTYARLVIRESRSEGVSESFDVNRGVGNLKPWISSSLGYCRFRGQISLIIIAVQPTYEGLFFKGVK